MVLLAGATLVFVLALVFMLLLLRRGGGRVFLVVLMLALSVFPHLRSCTACKFLNKAHSACTLEGQRSTWCPTVM